MNKMIKLKFILTEVHFGLFILVLTKNEQNDQTEVHFGLYILVLTKNEQNDQTEVHFGLYI